MKLNRQQAAAFVIAFVLIALSCAKSKPLTNPDPEPQATATLPVPTPTPRDNFETGINTWTRSTTGDQRGVTQVAHDATGTSVTAFNGSTGSLRAGCAFTGALGSSNFAKGVVFKTYPTLDITGKRIIFRVYIPADLVLIPAYGIQLYIKSTGAYTWADGGFNNIAAAGWQTYEWNLATSPPSAGSAADVREIGFQIGKGTGAADWSGSIWVDDVVY